MTQSESVAFFLRLIQEKHQEMKQQTDSLLRLMASEDLDRKRALAKGVFDRAQTLKSMLAKKDVPSWLDSAVSSLSAFCSANYGPADFLVHLIAWKPVLDNHRWSFENSTEQAIDFDTIYERFRSESRLPELFESVVRILEEIQASGEVDSVLMMNALNKVIATIKQCQNGSYFSVNAAWDFLWTFVKNYLWNELGAIPGLGTAAAALKTAMESINDEMFTLHTKINSAINDTVGVEIKKLQGKASTPFLTYNKDGHSLPELSVNLLDSKA